jgi:hypothetical protein
MKLILHRFYHVIVLFFLVAIERGCPEVLFQPDRRGDESIVYAFAVFYKGSQYSLCLPAGYGTQDLKTWPDDWVRTQDCKPP